MMDSKNHEDGQESPKKKVRPSSTTNLILPVADSLESTDSSCNGLEDQDKLVNYVAPTRKGRLFEAPSSSEKNEAAECSKEDPSIQEEVVSSSESCSTATAKRPVPSVGDADSLTNDSEGSDQLEAEESAQKFRNTKGDPEEK